MNTIKQYDLLGIGLGPFNLSLAALLSPLNELNLKFCESKSEFRWHPELMFCDADMQTSYLKDLVTPVDPTNPHSFLNYLVKKGIFYHFLNSNRKTITRIEFEDYARWVSIQLKNHIDYDSHIIEVDHKNSHFVVKKRDSQYHAKHLCVATGPVPSVPECAKPYIGPKVFHAKSDQLKRCNMTGQRVLIVGGGQTGIEIFHNSLKDTWGRPESIQLISSRENLRPLEEGPFVDEIFTPDFVGKFQGLDQKNKDQFSSGMLLSSDGNTPSYLQNFYKELYLDRFYRKEFCRYRISPMRWLNKIEIEGPAYRVSFFNRLQEKVEVVNVDLIILATGFKTQLPPIFEGIKDKFYFDKQLQPVIELDYRLKTDLGPNSIYVMNFSRHNHGLSDPQTSLMAWRSAVISNSILGREHFSINSQAMSFLDFFQQENTSAQVHHSFHHPIHCLHNRTSGSSGRNWERNFK